MGQSELESVGVVCLAATAVACGPPLQTAGADETRRAGGPGSSGGGGRADESLLEVGGGHGLPDVPDGGGAAGQAEARAAVAAEARQGRVRLAQLSDAGRVV